MTETKPTLDQGKQSGQASVDWEDRYKRLAAELENTKKRLARNSAQAIEQMQDQLLIDMLSFADDLERILENEKDYQECPRLREGVQITFRSLQSTLKRYGIEPIEALKRPFDPTYHEAAALVEHPSHPGGIIIEVLQSGYLRHGRLIRPAKVVVSAD